MQHAHLETHGSIAWMEDGRLNVRTSSQSPSIAKVKLAHLFALRPDQLRVFCKRVGGGFGGKQEVISEDLVALATLDTGRPVCFEYTREEEFTTASPRHPMKLTVKLGAKADGTLTAFQVRNVSNTGAYGNHGGETLFAGGAAVMIYRCPNKKYDAYSVYTNTVPSGALRGYGMTQPAFAVESAMDELALALHIDPLELRRRNIVRPGDPLVALHDGPDDVMFTEDGLGKCIDLVDRRPGPTADEPAPGSGLARRGRASRAPCTRPRPRPSTSPRPGSRSATTSCTSWPSARSSSARARRPRTSRSRPTSSARRRRGSAWCSPTPTARDSTPAPSRARDSSWPATRCCGRPNAVRDRILEFAAAHTGVHVGACARWTTTASSAADQRVPLAELVALARARGIRFTAARKAYGSPRSVVSNTHGFRIAVHRVTGEIRVLYSVQATDAGVIINPAQVRGQVEGGVAQGIGFALTENFHVDADGAMVNPNLRNYRIPTYADVPRTEVLLVDSADSVGPMRCEGHGGVLHQPGRPRAGERAPGRHGRPLPGTAADARTHLRPAGVENRASAPEGQADMDTEKRTDRHRGDGHHRPAGPPRTGVGVRDLAGGRQRRRRRTTPASSAPRSSAPTAVQPDWVVVYRFDSDRPPAGLDQQRRPGSDLLDAGGSSTSTAPRPSR